MADIKFPKERILMLHDKIDTNSCERVIKSIHEINTDDFRLGKVASLYGFNYKPDPIQLHINSPGGSVYDALGLISIMSTSTTPVNTYVQGKAMSAALLILICGQRRYAYQLSTCLIHSVSSIHWGMLEDLKDQLAESTRLQEIINKLITSRTDVTKKQLKSVTTSKKDWFITPEEALKLRIIDNILWYENTAT